MLPRPPACSSSRSRETHGSKNQGREDRRPRKAGKAAAQARTNPYVQRFIEDPELRDNVRAAFESARKAYKRMQNGKGPAKALMEDRKLQKELRNAAGLAEAGGRPAPAASGASGTPRRKLLMLAILGGIAALIALGGRAQGGAGPGLRRRGGVRVHLDAPLRTPARRRASANQIASATRAPQGAPFRSGR